MRPTGLVIKKASLVDENKKGHPHDADDLLCRIPDSNLGPLFQTGALPGCATSECNPREGGIRTLGTTFEVRRFSKPLFQPLTHLTLTLFF